MLISYVSESVNIYDSELSNEPNYKLYSYVFIDLINYGGYWKSPPAKTTDAGFATAKALSCSTCPFWV